MASLNKVQLIGNLGRDPDLRFMPDGTAVTVVSLATSDAYTNKTTGALVKSTEWHRVVFFSRLAEIAGEFLEKGSTIYIEGKNKTRKWADKDGIDRYTTEIRVGELIMLGGNHKKDVAPDAAEPSYSDDSDDDRDIPF